MPLPPSLAERLQDPSLHAKVMCADEAAAVMRTVHHVARVVIASVDPPGLTLLQAHALRLRQAMDTACAASQSHWAAPRPDARKRISCWLAGS